MNKLLTNCVLTVIALSASTTFAETDGHDYSGNLSLASDYMYRGQSQTGNNPAVSAGFDYAFEPMGFYMGTWASNVNFGGDIEIDWYGGFAGNFSDTGITWDAGLLYYQYPGSTNEDDLDFIEGHVSLGYSFADVAGQPAVSIAIHYSPDWSGGNGNSVFYDGNIDFSLPHGFTVSTHLGYQTIEDNTNWGSPDWIEYSIGVSRSFNMFELALSWVDTDLNKSQCYGGDNICDGRVLFSVSSSF